MLTYRFLDGIALPTWLCGVVKRKFFSYWIFDSTPREREALSLYLKQNELAHVLYTGAALKRSDGNEMLMLTAGERNFIQWSWFDKPHELRHLYFLDTELQKVMLYRGLNCVHGPNLYDWRVVHELDWSACKISGRTGEIVADGEAEWKPEPVIPQKTAHMTDRLAVAEHSESETAMPETPRESVVNLYDIAKASAPVKRSPNLRATSSSASASKHSAMTNWVNRPLKCKLCGTLSADYPVSELAEGTCICRACFPAYSEAKKKAYSQGTEFVE